MSNIDGRIQHSGFLCIFLINICLQTHFWGEFFLQMCVLNDILFHIMIQFTGK